VDGHDIERGARRRAGNPPSVLEKRPVLPFLDARIGGVWRGAEEEVAAALGFVGNKVAEDAFQRRGWDERCSVGGMEEQAVLLDTFSAEPEGEAA
jgi:hypothetical protein